MNKNLTLTALSILLAFPAAADLSNSGFKPAYRMLSQHYTDDQIILSDHKDYYLRHIEIIWPRSQAYFTNSYVYQKLPTLTSLPQKPLFSFEYQRKSRSGEDFRLSHQSFTLLQGNEFNASGWDADCRPSARNRDQEKPFKIQTPNIGLLTLCISKFHEGDSPTWNLYNIPAKSFRQQLSFGAHIKSPEEGSRILQSLQTISHYKMTHSVN